MLSFISSLILPLILCGVALSILVSKRVSFDDFIQGAREGMQCTAKLLPVLVALLVGTSMLRASGVTALLSELLAPALGAVGVPPQILPLLLTRPFSGSASNAMFASLLTDVGADSFAAACAAVIMGSSDTLLYIVPLYASAAGVKKTRHALPVAFLVMIFCIFFACLVCRVIL